MIDGGLTGVVGPNGCGKSNVVEALRWVMGENSAKRLRGDDMDDVIFSGTSTRPARNFAEAQLTLKTAGSELASRFPDADELVISRRIDRGSGSTFRINGKESRARMSDCFSPTLHPVPSRPVCRPGQGGCLD